MIAIPEHCEHLEGEELMPCHNKPTHYLIVEDNEVGGIEFYCNKHAKQK